MATLWRLAYRSAYLLARAWWFVRRPRTRGALVAIWSDGCVLLVRSSYRRGFGLPGGFVKLHENPRDAAVREVAEELHVAVAPAALTRAWQGTRSFEHRLDDVTIWEVTLDERPAVRIDGREVIAFVWDSRADALARDLVPHVRAYLNEAPAAPTR
jgi:8-oxo-dGTP pyrophosphatase MutT (NUDIX family)